MRLALLLLALLVGAGLAWIRLAPSDPARWHVDPAVPGADTLTGEPGGARGALTLPGRSPAEVLARLDAIARATRRTTRLAGSPEEGRITWLTRSAAFGFPDYTTAQAVQNGSEVELTLHARQRFGRDDFGVNAARLRDWTAALTTP
ncbi:DUF1499 domain-containing protein [Defluviimonas sp. WL0024]|uniref:DUF1499 domain-containing protein n=1 Tax=Albidovulum salinarum TaxID=2984153 RepID=A0ABT2WYB8_9RHOB|nr:DUF1499 domain-containing protein [Defluviimonas sp. WL0024]MCU9846469.1 DUF1499 domain-containing protein [Defluviimonas sp. WL0024]